MYHSQQIRWNEEYPLIPGLANLEVRFGANSNYFLLASIFTFRFLFGEALFALHSLLALLILAWIIRKVFSSCFDIKTILLLAVYTIFIYVNIPDFRGVSGDIIPNLIVFYLFVRLILNPLLLQRNFLFYLFVPFVLATFKLSAGLFVLIGIYPLTILIKEKQYKAMIFICTVIGFVLIPWLIRNVMLSGYLIHPLYIIDVFSFDWKVPPVFLELESDYIRNFAQSVFMKQINGPTEIEPLRFHLIRYIYLSVYILLMLSPVYIALLLFKNNNKNKAKTGHRLLLYIYAILFLNIIFWFVSAPDPRFISGCLFVTIFLCVYISFPKRVVLPARSKLYLLLTGIFIIYLLFDGIKWIKTYSDGSRQMLHSIYMPQFDSDKRYIKRPVYTAYELDGEVIIYVTSDAQGKCFDFIPCVKIEDDSEANYQDYKNLEARGNNIQQGFRYRSSRHQ